VHQQLDVLSWPHWRRSARVPEETGAITSADLKQLIALVTDPEVTIG
jgi:hypothetical protein